MEEVIKIMSLLDEEDKKSLSEFACILFKKNKYTQLRKEIEARRAEIVAGKVLSHKEIWQDL